MLIAYERYECLASNRDRLVMTVRADHDLDELVAMNSRAECKHYESHAITVSYSRIQARVARV